VTRRPFAAGPFGHDLPEHGFYDRVWRFLGLSQSPGARGPSSAG
jgi:hypothetical protein